MKKASIFADLVPLMLLESIDSKEFVICMNDLHINRMDQNFFFLFESLTGAVTDCIGWIKFDPLIG